MLVPDDYGLMEMATIITGYAAIFSELGVGAAIIQKGVPTKDELSTIFWFSFFIGIVMSAFCFIAAYPTSKIFNEPRVIPLTSGVSIAFLLSSLTIVPYNLIKKDLNFKFVGFIEFVGISISSIGMVILAYYKLGPWTLLGGGIIRIVVRLVMLFTMSNWRPSLHFKYSELRSYLKFGVIVSFGESLHYAYSKSDSFFAGRAWPSQALGYYALAKQLAQLPTEKITVLINQVSFSAFSKLQDDLTQFNKLYLQVVKVTAILVFPLFIGGFLIGDVLIKVVLGVKWIPIVIMFKGLCIAQIMASLNAVNNFVHTSQGRPQWALWFNIVMTALMPASFYFATNHGVNTIIIPWISTYIIICIIWIICTLNKIGIGKIIYIKSLFNPIAASTVMVITFMIFDQIIKTFLPTLFNDIILLISEISLCCGAYILYFAIFEREVLIRIRNIKDGF